MGFGDFLKAGAEALGVDTDDIGGLFDQAKGALGEDGDAGDLFSAAAQRLGVDADDVSSISQVFGGGGPAGGGSPGGGFGGVVSSFLGEGDDAAGTAIKGFGALFGGGDVVSSVSDYLPASVKDAMSEASDLPFVTEAASGSWADLAGSVPGLNGALGSLGLSTTDVATHIENVAGQSVDSGSAWSFGNMLADQGTAFMGKVAASVDADGVWGSVPGVAAGAQQNGRFLADGGFVPTEVVSAADLWDTDDTTGETDAPAVVDPSEVEPTIAAHDEFASQELPHQPVPDLAPADADPAFEEVAAAPPDQFVAADELEGGLDGLGDDVFG